MYRHINNKFIFLQRYIILNIVHFFFVKKNKLAIFFCSFILDVIFKGVLYLIIL